MTTTTVTAIDIITDGNKCILCHIDYRNPQSQTNGCEHKYPADSAPKKKQQPKQKQEAKPEKQSYKPLTNKETLAVIHNHLSRVREIYDVIMRDRVSLGITLPDTSIFADIAELDVSLTALERKVSKRLDTEYFNKQVIEPHRPQKHICDGVWCCHLKKENNGA